MGRTIITLFEDTVKRRGAASAARYRNTPESWAQRSWTELDAARREVAAGLIELGVEADDRVNILSNTRIEWMEADLGILSAGGTTVPIYQSSLADDCRFIIDDCGGVVVFAEDKSQVDKLLGVKAQIPRVRKVIVFSGETDGTDWTMSYEDFRALGRGKLEAFGPTIAERSAAANGESVLTLIYTSGTTGRPKGVVLTHDNMVKVSEASVSIGLLTPDDVQLLFLPMAHVFAKLLECTWYATGHEMVVDGEITRITQNMGEVKPTVMASVPRIFEKVYARVVGNGLETPGLKGRLFKWAMDLNDRCAQLRIEGKPVPTLLQLQLKLAKRLVFSKINERLQGIFGGRLRFFISGGAPLPKKMAYFFDNAGVTILEGYGLTETSAATTVNRPDRNKLGSVGAPLPGTEVKIAEDGEILIRGPGVMREYWNRPDATAEVLLPGGWFASGDIGVMDDDGYVTITDRKKDIIVTAGGKNVAPQNIESAVKAANPLISQVMVHGDKRKFLVALVTLEPEAAAKLGEEKGIGADYVSVTGSDAARAEVKATFERVNENLARYETVKEFHILDKDFEIGDELTPTLKVKRKHCNQKYKDILDRFYDERVAD